jgi:hypothetical protein
MGPLVAERRIDIMDGFVTMLWQRVPSYWLVVAAFKAQGLSMSQRFFAMFLKPHAS